MIHSRLISFINRHSILQGIFVLMPIVFCIVYFFAFLADYANIYGAAVDNTKYVKSLTNSDNLVEVKTNDLSKDLSKYITTIAINKRYKIQATTSYIMGVYYVDKDWLRIIAPNTEDIIVPANEFDFIKDLKKNKDGTITFKIDGEKYTGFDTQLFTVYDKDRDNKTYELNLENGMVVFDKKINQLSYCTDKYVYHASYSNVVTSKELVYSYRYFKDKKTYFDIRTKQCIKDLDISALKEFYNASNIWLFIVSMIGYYALLMYFYKTKELKLVTKKILILNGIGIISIPFLFIITLVTV